MRTATLSFDRHRLISSLLIVALAGATSVGLLWASSSFETKWLFASVLGLLFFLVALCSARFERFMLGVIFITIPINLDVNFDFSNTIDRFNLPTGTPRFGISVIDIALCALFVIWLFRWIANSKNQSLIWPSGLGLLLSFLAWAGLTMFWARDLGLSLGLWLSFLKAVFYFFFVANYVRTSKELWFIAKCMIVGLVLESLICGAQHAVGGNLGLSFLGEPRDPKEIVLSAGTMFRVSGTMGHSNALGGYLAMLIPLTLAAALAPASALSRIFTGASFVLGSTVLFLSYCRSAWLVTFLACAILVLRSLIQRPRSLPLIFGIFLSLVIVLGAFLPQIKGRLLEDDKGSAVSRLSQWKMAGTVIKSHPLLGVGLNNYAAVAHLYETNVESEDIRGRVYLYQGRIHNVFLVLAAEVGLTGLFLMLLFFGVAAFRGWQNFAAARSALAASLLTGMALGLFGRLFHDFVHTGNFASNMFIWIYSACLVSSSIRDSS